MIRFSLKEKVGVSLVQVISAEVIFCRLGSILLFILTLVEAVYRHFFHFCRCSNQEFPF
jgi:hypothetical protein